MPAATSYHVIRNPYGGWNVQKDGARRASRHFESKQEAISWGRELSKREGSVFVIHRRDGTIQRKDILAKDPLLPRDRS